MGTGPRLTLWASAWDSSPTVRTVRAIRNCRSAGVQTPRDIVPTVAIAVPSPRSLAKSPPCSVLAFFCTVAVNSAECPRLAYHVADMGRSEIVTLTTAVVAVMVTCAQVRTSAVRLDKAVTVNGRFGTTAGAVSDPHSISSSFALPPVTPLTLPSHRRVAGVFLHRGRKLLHAPGCYLPPIPS